MGVVSHSYPPRIQAFRAEIMRVLPRTPNDWASLESLRSMPTHGLILAFLTWRMRFVPAKPRMVRLWTHGVTPLQFQTLKPKLRPFLEKVTAGKDLTPHLSELVNKSGIDLNRAQPCARRRDIDMVLTRAGLHHFHVGAVGPGNPKGRSHALIFAEVLEKEFRLVALSDHRVFERSSSEHLRFFAICHAYMAKDVPPGHGFMANPVMSSGHSMLVRLFANKCEEDMQNLDPWLDDPAFIDKLYGDQPILRNAESIMRPGNPSLSWDFEDLEFGIRDRRTGVFFCRLPFFAR